MISQCSVRKTVLNTIKIQQKETPQKIKLYRLHDRSFSGPLITNGTPYSFEEVRELATGWSGVTKTVFQQEVLDELFPKIVWLISGKNMDKSDFISLKQLWQEVAKVVKAGTGPESPNTPEAIVLGCLTHLFVGFKVANVAISHDNANALESYSATIHKLLTEKELSITTILCAQRESNAIDPDALVKEVDEFSVRKFKNLLHGMVENIASIEKADVTVFQPLGTKKSLVSVFPTIIEKALLGGGVESLLKNLERIAAETLKILSATPESKLTFTMDDAGLLYEKTIIARRELFPEIKTLFDLERRADSILNKKTDTTIIAQIAAQEALPIMRRIIANYDDLIKKIKDADKQEIIPYVYPHQQGVDLMADKALIETVFYFLLGQLCKRDNSLFMGLERDQNLYKIKAFKAGYGSLPNRFQDPTKLSNIPFLIARRMLPINTSSSSLGSISFRQFWRVGAMTDLEVAALENKKINRKI